MDNKEGEKEVQRSRKADVVVIEDNESVCEGCRQTLK